MSLLVSELLSSEGFAIEGDTFAIENTKLSEQLQDISFEEVIVPIESPNIVTTDFSALEGGSSTLISDFPEEQLPPLSSVDLTEPFSAPYSLSELVDEDIRRTTQSIEKLVQEAEELNDIIQEELEKIPNHPWDRFVAECIDPKTYVPLTIQDLEIADDFCPSTYVPFITAIGEKYDAIGDLHIQEFEKNSDREDHIGNVFAVLSGDQFVLDKPKAIEFIRFAELIRNMPLELIDANPMGVASRLISHYVKINS
jgi:hypothetical protein